MALITAPTIYSRLHTLASPILTEYRVDLTVHDRAACRAMKPGDTAIWGVRPWGTHIHFYRQGGETSLSSAKARAKRALEWIEAEQQTWPHLRWYLVECTSPQRGSVSPLKFDEAVRLVKDTRDRMASAEAEVLRKRAA